MANAPSKVILVAVVVVGIAGMVMLNSYSGKNLTIKSDDDHDDQQQQASPSAPPPAAPVVKVQKPASPGSLVSLGEQSVVGSTSSAGPEVDVRWSWTPSVQSDPTKVSKAVSALQSALPGVKVHVVNTDESPGTANGVFVGSKLIAPAARDGSIEVDPLAVKSALGASK